MGTNADFIKGAGILILIGLGVLLVIGLFEAIT